MSKLIYTPLPEAGHDVHDVYEAYEHDERWNLEALEQSAEIIGATAASIFVDPIVAALFLSPAGWVVILRPSSKDV